MAKKALLATHNSLFYPFAALFYEKSRFLRRNRDILIALCISQ